MYGYIYKTTNLINGKFYIGQKKSNIFLNEKYLGSGKRLKRAIQYYGKNNFKVELIEKCINAEHLNEREIYWIKELDALNPKIAYNIASGGAFGDSGYHLGMLGKNQSEYQKQRASESNSHPKSEQMKQKMSKAMKGNKNAHNGLGKKFIHKGNLQTRVFESEFEKYLANGWKIGKSDLVRSNQSKAYKKKYANGKYISKNGVCKFVDNSILNDYLLNGWQIGKKH